MLNADDDDEIRLMTIMKICDAEMPAARPHVYTAGALLLLLLFFLDPQY